TFGELLDQRVAHTVYIHDAAGGEMQNGLAQLGRTVGVDAAVIGFAFGAHNLRAAFRTSLRHVESLVSAGMIFVFDYLGDFGNDVSTTLYLHPIADLDAEALDLVHVMKSRVANGGAANRDRSQHGHW